MEVLNRHLQRMRFCWQQSPFGHRWLTVMLGFVLLLVALAAHAFFKQQQSRHALQQLPAITKKSIAAMQTPEAKAVDSLQQWPAEDEAERISAEILAQADAMGMVFERAEFQSVTIEHSSLQVQRIKLPLKAEYPQVRQFLKSVLQAYPSLALSQFKLQRSDVLQTGIEAYVEFSLYTRKREQT